MEYWSNVTTVNHPSFSNTPTLHYSITPCLLLFITLFSLFPDFLRFLQISF